MTSWATESILKQRLPTPFIPLIYEGKPLDLSIRVPGLDLLLNYQVHGIKERHVIYCINKIYRSPLINWLFRFVKSALLRRSLDLTNAIHGRHLPFGWRLDLRPTSKTSKDMTELKI